MLKTTFLICFLFSLSLADNNSYDDLFLKYGSLYNLHPNLLKAIAKTESNLNPNAVNKANKNGTIDRGLMQINSIHLNDGLDAEDLFDPEINIHEGAKVLRYCIDKHGLTWQALNCYNGKIQGNDYNLKVLSNLEKLNNITTKQINYASRTHPSKSSEVRKFIIKQWIQ